MKLDGQALAALLRNPASTRLVLLYGDDEGLIRERSQALTRQVAGRLDDPFLVVELAREGWSRIAGEMSALSMIGGRRVIVVREVTDAILGPVTDALKGPGEALLVLEAPGLGRGKLRSLAEASREAAAVACYPEEGQALGTVIAGLFAGWGVTADPDAVAWLSHSLVGDRAVLRSEVEKLALLASAGGRVDMDMARACTSEAASSAGDDGLLAATLGDVAECDEAIEAALADGLNGVALLRMANGQLQRLHQARLRMDGGVAVSEAVRAMRPPVYYKVAAKTGTVLGMWTTAMLLRVLEEARRAELACKQTGSRPELIARRFVQSIARTAQAQRGKASSRG